MRIIMTGFIGKAIICLFCILSTSIALAHDWTDPNSPFNADTKMTNSVHVTWMTASNVNKACEAESIRRGNGGFKGAPMQACTFWTKTPNGYECLMITSKNPTIHNLGHEIRHCFQGNYH